ncbi:MAG: dephospho-CoA kinase [Nitrosomonas sp.]|nr:dephospho-CoA kinase [Nitrosomonas sp.]MCW5606598.1 dephospho-CoA kinase [Nitrosomonas sp.]
MALIIGLTGGIGCGKSSACKVFTELGVDVIDTDQIAYELTQHNGTAIPAIRNLFGNEYINSEGALDRMKMRNLVFMNSNWRIKLERLLHPLILETTTKRIQYCKSSYVIVAIPLLFETNDYNHLIHRILVVDCDEQFQITRTMMRSHLSMEEVKAIITTQVNRRQRLEKADDIIINNQDFNHLREQVVCMHRKYVNLSSQHTPDY